MGATGGNSEVKRSGGSVCSFGFRRGQLQVFVQQLQKFSRMPRFQAYHTVDVIQLIACGMCFGVALMWFAGRLSRKTGE